MRQTHLLAMVAAPLALGLSLWWLGQPPPTQLTRDATNSTKTAAAATRTAVALASTATPLNKSPEEAGIAEPPNELAGALQRLSSLDERTPANKTYDIFRELKAWMQRRGPEAIDQVVMLLLEPGNGSEAAKRQRSLMYGALAETDHPEAVHGLVAVLQKGLSEDDTIQAAAALGDHPQPTGAALDALWQESTRLGSGYGYNASLLAFGSVAHRLGTGGEEASQRLLAKANAVKDNSNAHLEVLAAMGNHGHVSYLSHFQETAAKGNDELRAAALYGARHIKGEQAAQFILSQALTDPSDHVKVEAMRALELQVDQRRDYLRLSQIALSSGKFEIQAEAARMLKSARGRHSGPEVQAALDQLHQQTAHPAVRAIIEQK